MTRNGHGAGILQRTGLVLAGLLILALTFTLGMLVGRQWARPTAPVVTAEPARKGAVPARRNGLAEVETVRPKGLQDRLTFYQTLTAPLGAPASPASAAPGPKGKLELRPRADVPSQEEGPQVPPTAGEPGGSQGAGATAVTTEGAWTVQVGAFRSRKQADAVQQGLVGAGFPAQVSAKAAEDGQLRYRVRVGTFRAKAEAEGLAERLRAERSLATYVTTHQ